MCGKSSHIQEGENKKNKKKTNERKMVRKNMHRTYRLRSDSDNVGFDSNHRLSLSPVVPTKDPYPTLHTDFNELYLLSEEAKVLIIIFSELYHAKKGTC